MGMPYIGINVSDVEASVAFYRRFGYTNVAGLTSKPLPQRSLRHGLQPARHLCGADVALDRGDRHRLRLLQWIAPLMPSLPIRRRSITRHQSPALTVPDVERAVSILTAQKVPFLSEVAPCCSGTDTDTGGIVHAIDPDGVFLELVGDLTPRPVPPQPSHCPPLEIRYPAKAQ